MSKIKQYIDLMTPMEAYQKGRNDAMNADEESWCDGYDKGYKKGQEDVCTVSVSDIYEKGYKQGIKEVVEWVREDLKWSSAFREQVKKWGIKNENCND